MRAPRFARGLEALEVQDARARGRDEAAGARAHRARRLLGLVVEAAREHAHRVEAGPDVVAVALAAAAQHALGEAVRGSARRPRRSPRCRCCTRCCSTVTWLPRASRPLTRAETPLPITCSTIVEPRRRTLPASVIGTRRSPTVSRPPTPVPDHRARLPVHVVVGAVGAREAGVRPGVDGGDRAVAVVGVHRQQQVGVEVGLRDRVGALRHAGHRAAEAQLRELRHVPQAGPSRPAARRRSPRGRSRSAPRRPSRSPRRRRVRRHASARPRSPSRRRSRWRRATRRPCASRPRRAASCGGRRPSGRGWSPCRPAGRRRRTRRSRR